MASGIAKDAKEAARVQDGEQAAIGSDELGTGYEEDTDTGTLSSVSSVDSSVKGGFSPQSASLFKPVQEKKDETEMTLDDLRGTKAPGPLDRAKEEVEAISDMVLEGFNMKPKPGASENDKDSENQGGVFDSIAEKIGYGGKGGSQSQ